MGQRTGRGGAVTHPSNEAQLATLIAQQESLTGAVSEIKDAMHQMAAAVQKLAIIDERQANDRQSIDRAFSEIEKLNTRVKDLEDAAPAQKQASDWVHRSVSQIVSAVIAATLALVVGGRLAAPLPAAPSVKQEAATRQ
jgi:chromosome segregation ATPase